MLLMHARQWLAQSSVIGEVNVINAWTALCLDNSSTGYMELPLKNMLQPGYQLASAVEGIWLPHHMLK